MPRKRRRQPQQQQQKIKQVKKRNNINKSTSHCLPLPLRLCQSKTFSRGRYIIFFFFSSILLFILFFDEGSKTILKRVFAGEYMRLGEIGMAAAFFVSSASRFLVGSVWLCVCLSRPYCTFECLYSAGRAKWFAAARGARLTMQHSKEIYIANINYILLLVFHAGTRLAMFSLSLAPHTLPPPLHRGLAYLAVGYISFVTMARKKTRKGASPSSQSANQPARTSRSAAHININNTIQYVYTHTAGAGCF